MHYTSCMAGILAIILKSELLCEGDLLDSTAKKRTKKQERALKTGIYKAITSKERNTP